MDEKIVIKKQDFYEIMYLMEKILYIAERSGPEKIATTTRILWPSPLEKRMLCRSCYRFEEK